MSVPLKIGPDIERSTDIVSFRVIVLYDVGTDGLTMRLDVKSDVEQRGAEISVGKPSVYGPVGNPRPMFTPNRAVEASCGVVADREALIQSLEGLIEHLKANVGKPVVLR
jgi:hypothetical protein